MVHIVLIEDNPQTSALIRKILQFHGYNVTCAATGLDGIRCVETLAPDLVLLDIELPDFPGETVAQYLRDWLYHIPIVAITATTSVVVRRLAMATGCREVISKPIDTRQFPMQIAKYLAAVTR
jgi:CheY-like chemotaxis protein